MRHSFTKIKKGKNVYLIFGELALAKLCYTDITGYVQCRKIVQRSLVFQLSRDNQFGLLQMPFNINVNLLLFTNILKYDT